MAAEAPLVPVRARVAQPAHVRLPLQVVADEIDVHAEDGLVLRADPAGAELRTVSAAIDSGDDTDTGDGRSASSDGQSSTTTPDLEGS